MPQYLTLYTPAKQQEPTKAHMEKMNAFMNEMLAEGIIAGGGGLRNRELGALNLKLDGGKFTVAEGESAAREWMKASGFAILNVKSKEHLLQVGQRFLEVAGDGTSEVIELMAEPPQPVD